MTPSDHTVKTSLTQNYYSYKIARSDKIIIVTKLHLVSFNWHQINNMQSVALFYNIIFPKMRNSGVAGDCVVRTKITGSRC